MLLCAFYFRGISYHADTTYYQIFVDPGKFTLSIYNSYTYIPFVLQTYKISVDGYNLMVGFLQNSDLLGISLSDNDIRLSSYRV